MVLIMNRGYAEVRECLERWCHDIETRSEIEWHSSGVVNIVSSQ